METIIPNWILKFKLESNKSIIESNSLKMVQKNSLLITIILKGLRTFLKKYQITPKLDTIINLIMNLNLLMFSPFPV
jgi:hypothetical protein